MAPTHLHLVVCLLLCLACKPGLSATTSLSIDTTPSSSMIDSSHSDRSTMDSSFSTSGTPSPLSSSSMENASSSVVSMSSSSMEDASSSVVSMSSSSMEDASSSVVSMSSNSMENAISSVESMSSSSMENAISSVESMSSSSMENASSSEVSISSSSMENASSSEVSMMGSSSSALLSDSPVSIPSILMEDASSSEVSMMGSSSSALLSDSPVSMSSSSMEDASSSEVSMMGSSSSALLSDSPVSMSSSSMEDASSSEVSMMGSSSSALLSDSPVSISSSSMEDASSSEVSMMGSSSSALLSDSPVSMSSNSMEDASSSVVSMMGPSSSALLSDSPVTMSSNSMEDASSSVVSMMGSSSSALLSDSPVSMSSNSMVDASSSEVSMMGSSSSALLSASPVSMSSSSMEDASSSEVSLMGSSSSALVSASPVSMSSSSMEDASSSVVSMSSSSMENAISSVESMSSSSMENAISSVESMSSSSMENASSSEVSISSSSMENASSSEVSMMGSSSSALLSDSPVTMSSNSMEDASSSEVSMMGSSSSALVSASPVSMSSSSMEDASSSEVSMMGSSSSALLSDSPVSMSSSSMEDASSSEVSMMGSSSSALLSASPVSMSSSSMEDASSSEVSMMGSSSSALLSASPVSMSSSSMENASSSEVSMMGSSDISSVAASASEVVSSSTNSSTGQSTSSDSPMTSSSSILSEAESSSHSSVVPTPSSSSEEFASSSVVTTTTTTESTITTTAPKADPFYPYGPNQGDNSFDENYPRRSQPIKFKTSVPFGTRSFSRAYVVLDGVIMFGNQLYAGWPNFEWAQLRGRNLIAVFWSYMSRYESSTVYYQLYERDEDSTPNKTLDILTRASDELKKTPSVTSFKASTVLVATWVKVKPNAWYSWICRYYDRYLRGWNDAYYDRLYQTRCENNKEPEENTFQGVYVTDGRDGYAIYKYRQGGMTWRWNEDDSRKIEIGFVNDEEIKSYDVAFTSLTTTIDTDIGNFGEPGANIEKVGKIVNPAQECRDFFFNQVQNTLLNSNYKRYSDELFDCPCVLGRLGRQWGWMDGIRVQDSPLTYINCYALTPVAKRRLARLSGNPLNKKCCYRIEYPSFGWWYNWFLARRSAPYIREGQHGGRILGNDPWYWTSDVRKYRREDVNPLRQCCVDSDTCYLFNLIRPLKSCSPTAIFVTGRALGDPHIKTLDGKDYTMNGWGEYNLVLVDQEGFVLQGRTDRAKTNGTATNATVFVGFAAKEGNGSFQVMLNSTGNGMLIWANGQDVTKNFYSTENYEESQRFNDDVTVSKQDNGDRITAEASFPSGISVKTHVGKQNVEFTLVVPKAFESKVKGMMGNFNGDLSDEFILPDGTQLATNLTERQIFEDFASKWQVTDSDTIFVYDDGELASDYRHDNFEPLFREEVDPDKLAAAVAECGDPKADACIFDFLATGDKSFAEATKSINQEAVAENNDLANSLPTLALNQTQLTNERWSVVSGEATTIQLTGSDADTNDTLTYIIIGDVSGQTVSIDSNGLVSFTPNADSPVTLGFQVNDTKGGISPTIIIPVTVCSGCSSHGTCDETTTRQTGFNNTQFLVYVCECEVAWTGEDCETDLDYCNATSNPCLEGQDCIDIDANVQGNSTKGYECGPCPSGYANNSQLAQCSDVDECETSNPCDVNSVCHNTEGSFSCECNSGYRLDKDNKTICHDIEECLERISGCEQECTNTAGGFNCSCGSIYDLNSNGKTCDEKSNIPDSCKLCEQVCILNGSQAICSCNSGYRIDSNNSSKCINIDECTEGVQPCLQVCTDTEGSFNCSCYKGYQLDQTGQTCKACTKPFYGVNCASKCLCNGKGTCDPVKGCVCNNGWTGANCSSDVNECEDLNKCPVGQTCENTVGSFTCNCAPGFVKTGGSCVDIDECADDVDNTCDLAIENCVNSEGSYGCACKTGFTKGSSDKCEDIDECALGTHNCQSTCENVFGFYNCKCPFGFRLMADRESCEKAADLCKEYGNVTCPHTCKIDRTAKTATCTCFQGYTLSGKTECVDINECDFDHLNLCGDKTTCENVDASFKCSCPTGSKLENDERTCKTCTGGTWGVNCAKDCGCGLNAIECDPETGCKCKKGYRGEKCEEDIDECLTGERVCSSSQVCVNTPGNASCTCAKGLISSGDSCVDIDECGDGTNDCEQDCTNTPGSFECSCYSGYTEQQGKCIDVDECAVKTDKCAQKCVNLQGKYRCECEEGYKLDDSGVACSPSEVCQSNNNCSHVCARINGQDVCSCPQGMTLNTTNNEDCIDVDLCRITPCGSGCQEVNGNTSFVCVCNVGFKLNSDGLMCSECVQGTYGNKCSQECTCSASNTLSCNKETGGCNCKGGFEGVNCENDTNECEKNTANCGANSTCINTPGKYVCKCDPGFYTNNSLCVECAENFYGEECASRCDCDQIHTTECNKVTGICSCHDGWNGTRCDLDIDECSSPNNCSAVNRANWVCKNTPGSYGCSCNSGYEDKNGTCEDLDECAAAFSNQCEQNCTNTVGSFVCSCKSGYVVDPTDRFKCVDDDECKVNKGGCDANCINAVGTFSCSCNNGFTLLTDGKSCLKTLDYVMTITFDIDVTNVDFNDTTQTAYQELKANLTSQMLSQLKSKNPLVIDFIINKLSKGSLVVDGKVVLDISKTTDVTGSLIQTLLVLSQTDITINGQTVKPVYQVNGTKITETTEKCALLTMIKPCSIGTLCVVVNDVATCKVTTSVDDDDDDVPLIVGLSVGLPLLVFLIVLIAVVIYFKTKNKELVRIASREGHYNEAGSDSGETAGLTY